jgi:hypothetical protein
MVEGIELVFPRLRGADWRESSKADDLYNCIAWAVGVTTAWWWPVGPDTTFWPEGVPRADTLEAFQTAFATLGYVVCAGEELEPGFQKVALFATAEGAAKHAARQLDSGRWTSKLDRMQDIEHALRDLEGALYGSVVLVMKRPVPAEAKTETGTGSAPAMSGPNAGNLVTAFKSRSGASHQPPPRWLISGECRTAPRPPS